MGIDLTDRVQAAARVVQVDVIALIEAAIFGSPQLRQSSFRVEIREAAVLKSTSAGPRPAGS
jgi:hypothetical protein